MSSINTVTRVCFLGVCEMGGRGVVSENLDGEIRLGSLGGVFGTWILMKGRM